MITLPTAYYPGRFLRALVAAIFANLPPAGWGPILDGNKDRSHGPVPVLCQNSTPGLDLEF
jgi:hypothetical protein